MPVLCRLLGRSYLVDLMKAAELLAKISCWHEVPKGRNLKRIGWVDGYLLVLFQSGAVWLYGANIPEEEMHKLLRVPYPDKLFTTNIKNKFKAFRIKSAA